MLFHCAAGVAPGSGTTFQSGPGGFLLSTKKAEEGMSFLNLGYITLLLALLFFFCNVLCRCDQN